MARWDRLTLTIVGLTILTFLVFPFGRSANAPLAILAFIGLWLLATRWRQVWAQPVTRWLLILVAGLWIPQLLALPGAVNFERAWSDAIYYPLFGVAALPVVWAALRHDVLPVTLYSLLAIVFVWALDGLWQFATGNNVLGFPYNGVRLSGLFGENLTMGVVIAHLLPLLLEATRRLMQRCVAWGLVILPILAVIMLSGSRSAMLLMLFGLLLFGVLVLWFYRPRWYWIVGMVAVVFVGMAGTLALSPETRDRVERVGKIVEMDRESFNQATSKRGDVWLSGWEVAKDDPWLGVGVRGYELAAVDRGYTDRPYMHLHFFALDVQVSTGLVGLLAYLGAYIAFLVVLWRAGGGMAAGVGVVAAGLALLPINTHFGFYASYTLAIIWPIIGLGAALTVSARGVPVQADAHDRHSRADGNPGRR
ncbi:O-antigen ligase [Guyparkeria sp. SCN-R1]|uniref:O-antigen ligase family protein n=1 Tax=Guyparkeria sp. SCN-R1 TaxID=2341113 RepID=UPI00195CF4CF|nr:O-antigen ligase family protein [Guyparkeria sp. SCN-R1]